MRERGRRKRRGSNCNHSSSSSSSRDTPCTNGVAATGMDPVSLGCSLQHDAVLVPSPATSSVKHHPLPWRKTVFPLGSPRPKHCIVQQPAPWDSNNTLVRRPVCLPPGRPRPRLPHPWCRLHRRIIIINIIIIAATAAAAAAATINPHQTFHRVSKWKPRDN